MRGETIRAGSGASAPSRRALLRTLPYAAGLAALTGCGVRLDLPRPPPPVPTRRKVPDEDLLIAFVRDLRAVIVAETAVISTGKGGSVLPRLKVIHEAQVRVIEGRLTNDGVPTGVITAPPARASGATGATGTSVTTPAQLGAQVAGLVGTRWPDLAAATSDTRTLLVSASESLLAGAVQLGIGVVFPPTASTARPALVDRTAQLGYGFEVVAAQTDRPGRKRALATLAGVRGLAGDLAGEPSTTAWSLPFPVTTPAQARRLATHLLRAAIAAPTDLLGSSPTAAAIQDIAGWSARVAVLATDWSFPLTAFPGTT